MRNRREGEKANIGRPSLNREAAMLPTAVRDFTRRSEEKEQK